MLCFINIVLTKVIYYCYEKTKSKKVMIAGVVFYVLHLLVQVLNISSAQDILFGGLFVLILCYVHH